VAEQCGLQVRAVQGVGKSERNKEVAHLVRELVGPDNKEAYKDLQEQTSRFR